MRVCAPVVDPECNLIKLPTSDQGTWSDLLLWPEAIILMAMHTASLTEMLSSVGVTFWVYSLLGDVEN